jgi:CRP-like cAMP-binding protein
MRERVLKALHDVAPDAGLLRGMDEDCLRTFSAYLSVRSYTKGEKFFEEGDEGDFLGIIVNGKMGVRKRTEFSDRQVILATNSRGSFLGEFSMFDRKPRSATVEALEDSTVLILNRAGLAQLMREAPAIGTQLLEGIIRVLALRLRSSAERVSSIF